MSKEVPKQLDMMMASSGSYGLLLVDNNRKIFGSACEDISTEKMAEPIKCACRETTMKSVAGLCMTKLGVFTCPWKAFTARKGGQIYHKDLTYSCFHMRLKT